MKTLDEAQIRELFETEAKSVEAPHDLQDAALRRGRSLRSRRQWSRATLVTGLAAAVAALIVHLPFDYSTSASGPADAVGTASWHVDLYFLEQDPHSGYGAAARLVTEPASIDSSGDKPLDVTSALFAALPNSAAVNGFNPDLSTGTGPIADVNSVAIGDHVITVDIDRAVMDPYPTIDWDAPDGRSVMQQLVWTLDRALETELPVELTINGVPAKGIWLYKLDGPISLNPSAMTCPDNNPMCRSDTGSQPDGEG
jgi:hypothetical protein